MRPPTKFEYAIEEQPQGRRSSFLLSIPNPFYLISAALFVHGTVLPADGTLSPVGQVLLSLVYVLLCSLTTVWLVRRLRRWDDARSLVVIVTGMFLAISLELDDGLALLSEWARWSVTGGVLLFAVATFEFIRRGCRIELPRSFLFAFYAQWAVILLYPAGMLSDTNSARWQIALFTLVVAFGWLLYWPALGKAIPRTAIGWAYPACPWTLPVITGIASLIRLYFLTVSFDAVPDVYYARGTWDWSTIIGVDFSVPLILALSLLLGESGRRASCLVRQQSAVLLGVLSVFAALCPASEGVASDFRAAISEWLDLPSVAVTLSVLVLSFHWLRGIDASRLCWTIGVVVGGISLPRTGGQWGVEVGYALLAVATVVGLGYGYRRQSLLFWSLGVAGVYFALAEYLPVRWAEPPYRVAEATAVLLLSAGANRFVGWKQQTLASAAGLAWFVTLFPMVRDVFEERLPVAWLIAVALWIGVAIPFILRFGSQPMVIIPFGLMLLAMLLDLLMRLVVEDKTGRVSYQAVTIAGAILMFGCGIVLSHEKTRRESLGEMDQ